MSGSCSGIRGAVPDVVIEIVPLLPLGHREGQFPGHGSDPAAGQVTEAGLSKCHTCQDRDTHRVSSPRPGSCLKSHSPWDTSTKHFSETKPEVCNKPTLHTSVPVTPNLQRRAQSTNPWIPVRNPQAQASCHLCSLIQQFHMISLKACCPFLVLPPPCIFKFRKVKQEWFQERYNKFQEFQSGPCNFFLTDASQQARQFRQNSSTKKGKTENKGFDQSTSATLSRWIKKAGWKIFDTKKSICSSSR